MREINQVIENTQVSVFAVMSKMAMDYGAINLAQGYPDFEGPDFVIQRASESFHLGKNQYAPYPGIPRLRTQLAALYKREHSLDCDPEGFTLTAGATEAIFCSISSLVNPGDEVILFEPYYDSYLTTVRLAGGIPKFVTLKKPDFSFTREDLEAVVSEKTKLVLFNNPHNPSGRVFSKEELKILANFCIDYDLYCMSDEVYEFLIYDEAKHIPMISLPGMAERTIGISSFGKTFGLTGWKLGWSYACPKLTTAIRMVHQFVTFSINHPLQLAMADSLENIGNYLKDFKSTYQQKRDFFHKEFRAKGFSLYPSQGTYFALCDISQSGLSDVEYCEKLIKEKGVAAIPCSAFYSDSDEGKQLVRFCFAKKEETLRAASLKL